MDCICGSVEVPLLRRLILGGHDAAEVNFFFSVVAFCDAAGPASALSSCCSAVTEGCREIFSPSSCVAKRRDNASFLLTAVFNNHA